MSRRRPAKPERKQPTPQELLDNLLTFLEQKFYPNHPIPFMKDRPRLLAWVVLWPAAWLEERGVTLPPDRYREIFMAVFQDSLRFGNVDKIKYLPAWLRMVIQSHFDHHGEEIYMEAKSMRNLVEHAALIIGRLPVRQAAQAATETTTQFATARSLLIQSRKSKKTPPKPPINDQLTLL